MLSRCDSVACLSSSSSQNRLPRRCFFRCGNETGISRWVPGLLSKVDETAVQLWSDVLDYGLRNLWHVRWCIVVQQQWTSGQHPPPFLFNSFLAVHCSSLVGSSHGCLMWKVKIHQQHAFAIPENFGHDFFSRGWMWNFLSGSELAWFQCIDACLAIGVKIPMVDPCFIASYNAGQNVVWVGTLNS